MQRQEKRILIVDDDDAIRALLVTILRRRGLKVDTARSGMEAIERITSCHYALMLLDLMMPRMSGYEVLERLHGMPADLRPFVLVLTAGGEPRSLDPAIVAGTVRKPFDIEMLIDSVIACLAMLSPRSQIENCPPAQSDDAAGGRTSEPN
jgi:two-component system, OmpR family, response regulator QseB